MYTYMVLIYFSVFQVKPRTTMMAMTSEQRNAFVAQQMNQFQCKLENSLVISWKAYTVLRKCSQNEPATSDLSQ